MQAIFKIISAVYIPIAAASSAGFLISNFLSRRRFQIGGGHLERRVADTLARLLYQFGIPIGVANFIRKADLNASAWIAPLVAWMAILLAIFLSRQVLSSSRKIRPQRTRKSYIILSYLGNTSYLGFPVILLLPQLGAQYFSSAVLYDILGTLPAAYGLGVVIARSNRRHNGPPNNLTPNSHSEASATTGPSEQTAERHEEHDGSSDGSSTNAIRNALEEILKNPTLYAFFIGLYLKQLELPETLVQILNAIAWGSIMVALIVMGMRAQQLRFKGELSLAFQPVIIKTMLVPLLIGTGLTVLGLDGPQRLVLVLQTAMPCAFASLVIAENYDLDIKITVASIFLSCIVFAFMLPIWVWAFTTW